MGTSTDAILFYGFLIDEAEDWRYGLKDETWMDMEDPDPDDDEAYVDWEDHYMAKIGDPPPTVPYEGNEEVHSDYWRRRREAVQAIGVGIGYHCSGEYTMYYVSVEDVGWCANRGYPSTVDPAKLKVDPTWNERLLAFCKTMGLKFNEPAWYLASWWG